MQTRPRVTASGQHHLQHVARKRSLSLKAHLHQVESHGSSGLSVTTRALFRLVNALWGSFLGHLHTACCGRWRQSPGSRSKHDSSTDSASVWPSGLGAEATGHMEHIGHLKLQEWQRVVTFSKLAWAYAGLTNEGSFAAFANHGKSAKSLGRSGSSLGRNRT